MRRLIVDIFCVLFRLTHSKGLSMIVAVVYMAVLNMVMIQGLALLTEGWLPFMSMGHKLFSFPFYFITAAAVLGITYWLKPPLSIMTKEFRKGESSPLAVAAYTVFALLLFAYMKYVDKVF